MNPNVLNEDDARSEAGSGGGDDPAGDGVDGDGGDDPAGNGADGDRMAELYFKTRVCLHKAALRGNWKDVEKITRYSHAIINMPITERGDTALHIAASEGHVYLAQKLINIMSVSAINVENHFQLTALCYAATNGKVQIVKEMVKKDADVIRGGGYKPLYLAVLNGNTKMANFIFETVGSPDVFKSWPEEHQINTLLCCITSGTFDIAMKIFGVEGKLAVARNKEGVTPFLALARNHLAFRRNRLRCLGNIASKGDAHKCFDTLWDKTIREQDLVNVLFEEFNLLLFTAVESGNDDFVIELIRRYPDCMQKFDSLGYSVFHKAVLNRSLDVFCLLYEIHGVDRLIGALDEERNSILHLTARFPHQSCLHIIPGAALQMQREVLWYKAVENLLPPRYQNMKNKDQLTPHELFLREHEDLRKQGEHEIKQNAKLCMLLATLVTTVVFASAFVMPGGYDALGEPVLHKMKLFDILPISLMVSTVTSLGSMLIFASMLASRYLDKSFLHILPGSMVFGVILLFVSIVGMMTAFSRSLFYYKPENRVHILAALATVVAFMFLMTKCLLLFHICSWSFSSLWLFRSRHRLL